MGAGPSCNHCDPDKLGIEAAKPNVEILHIHDAMQSMEVGAYKNCSRDEEKLGDTDVEAAEADGGSATTAVPIAQQTLFQGHIQKSATETLNPKPFSVASLLGTVRVAVGQRAFKNKARNPEPINLAAAGLVVYQVVRVTNPSPYLACVSTRSLSAARVHFTLLILGQRNPS